VRVTFIDAMTLLKELEGARAVMQLSGRDDRDAAARSPAECSRLLVATTKRGALLCRQHSMKEERKTAPIWPLVAFALHTGQALATQRHKMVTQRLVAARLTCLLNRGVG